MVKLLLLKTVHKLILRPYYRQVRGMTLGTRTMVIDAQNQLLLVRHTYAPGWLLPGGGVERGETIFQAAVRELAEEAAITVLEEPTLHGLFLNDRQFPGDHVACLVVRQFSQMPFVPNAEIAEAQFFPHDAVPDDTSPGTRRRIAEVLGGAAMTRDW
jgi:8-oxo-dGTP pyrophosphatase MutT (NUDIX family)